MESYQINDLERLTGIKAHTIRIWEKRYGLITPSRSDTNRRYYDDEQVRRLLNVTTLLSYGHKISKIAALSNEEVCSLIEKETPDPVNAHVYTGYVNDLVTCMLAFDEPGFEKIFSAAVLRLGMYETMLRVVYPFLLKTGVLWSVNKAAPVQEHFASSIIRRKLMAVVDSLLPANRKNRRFLLFLPPDEWHDIGLLFANYVLRAGGLDTIYLGQNVPAENLPKVVEAVKPDAMLTLFISGRHMEETISVASGFAALGVPFYVSGSSDTLQLIAALDGDIRILRDVTSLNDILKEY
jgi:methanogenic corrinoid protein MtbC1